MKKAKGCYPVNGLYSTYTTLFFSSRYEDGIGIAGSERIFLPAKQTNGREKNQEERMTKI